MCEHIEEMRRELMRVHVERARELLKAAAATPIKTSADSFPEIVGELDAIISIASDPSLVHFEQHLAIAISRYARHHAEGEIS